jgi:LapD/MoxY periplasmic domain/Diguanylate cyclase, GGDEF domain
MTLMRQIGLLLAAVVLLALAGAVGVNLHAARDTLVTQLRVKNSDNAQSLALALSQQRGDAALMELLLAAQFDTGFYRRIRFVRVDGMPGFEREARAQPQRAPQWFAAMLPIESAPGTAQVSDGWRALGRVEVVSQAAWAHDELWRGSARSAGLLLLLGVLAIALAAAGVRRIRRPLDATVQQANALVDGRYLIVDEPRVPELKRVARAMNEMVERVRRLFEAQAAQVEALRREAHEDRTTALPHRAHFMQRLSALLGDEAGAAAGCLLLLRVAELAEVNRELGRDATDRALRALADRLRAWPAGEAFRATPTALPAPRRAMPRPRSRRRRATPSHLSAHAWRRMWAPSIGSAASKPAPCWHAPTSRWRARKAVPLSARMPRRRAIASCRLQAKKAGTGA